MGLEYVYLFDILDEGLIVVDKKNDIQFINNRAKDIFGLRNKYVLPHGSGKIEEGDIIIIGDTSFGDDDGGLESNDLKVLGIHNTINKGDYFLYIGKFGRGGEYSSDKVLSASYKLEKDIEGNNLKVEIDYNKKKVAITVNEKVVELEFIKSVGHIVVLDKNYNIKFYQAKGYTVRGETIKEILNGNNFYSKEYGFVDSITYIGKDINSIFVEGNTITEKIKESFKKGISIENIFDEINKRPVKYSIYSFKDKVAIKIEDMSEIDRLLKERNELMNKLSQYQHSFANIDFYFGNTQQMKSLETYIEQISKTNSSILILGESGTGKSSLAKYIHDKSNRKGKFIVINCGAIPESLIESELFGYVKGAFTGALGSGKRGLIEEADGGTVFLDEITELPFNIQANLLDAIQNRRVKPIGSNEYKTVDTRFICATNKDIIEEVEKGRFRQDLFYRINVFQIKLPSLRERKQDLYDLIYIFIREICLRYNIPTKKISNVAYYKLYNYNFPGNIRELENILERAINLSTTGTIEYDDILLDFTTEKKNKKLKDILEETEKSVIIESLKKNNGDKKIAMNELGIKKSAFYEKLKKFGIE